VNRHVTRADLARELRRVLADRTDHASLCSVTVRPIENGVQLLWADYLTNERGPLAVLPHSTAAGFYTDLLEDLRQWREEAKPKGGDLHGHVASH
jgi:hypothetical protein